METTTFTDQSSRLASANPGGASVLAAPAGSLILALPAAAPEFILTGQVRPGEPLAAAWGRLADELAVRQAELLGLMIYAPVALQPQIKRVMRVILGKTDWPVTWVDADDCEGRPLPGMQAFAVSGRPVSRVRLGDMVVGSVYDDGAARFCLLGGLGPADASVTAPAQARQTFDRLAAALESAGFALGDVVRTWFYNERILDWYGGLQPCAYIVLRRREIPHRLAPCEHGYWYAPIRRRGAHRGRLGDAAAHGRRSCAGNRLAVAMPGAGLRQLVQPSNGDGIGRLAPPARVGHREHPSGRPDRLGGRPPAPD